MYHLQFSYLSRWGLTFLWSTALIFSHIISKASLSKSMNRMMEDLCGLHGDKLDTHLRRVQQVEVEVEKVRRGE